MINPLEEDEVRLMVANLTGLAQGITYAGRGSCRYFSRL